MFDALRYELKKGGGWRVHRLRKLIGCDFNHGSSIHFSCIKIIIRDSKDHDSARHKAAEVHMRSIRVDHLRKEAEDEDNDTVTDAKGVEEDAPNTGDVKGAPDEFIGMPCRTGHLLGVADRSSNTMPKEEGLGEDVGSVEAADTHGNDVVEGCRGTNVDQADGARNAGHYHDCI